MELYVRPDQIIAHKGYNASIESYLQDLSYLRIRA